MSKTNLVIRFQRAGTKTVPFYNIIVTYSCKSAKANALARVGYFNPYSFKSLKDVNKLVIFKDLLNFWIAKGAKPSVSVQRLLFNQYHH